MNTTVIIIHHRGKDKGTKYKNSGTIKDDVDTLYAIEGYDKNTSVIELTLDKSRNNDIVRNISFKLDEHYNLKRMIDASSEEKIQNMMKIYEYLKNTNQPVNQQNIIEHFKNDISKHKIKNCLQLGNDSIWKYKRGERKELLYSILNVNDKSIHHYISKEIFGFLE